MATRSWWAVLCVVGALVAVGLVLRARGVARFRAACLEVQPGDAFNGVLARLQGAGGRFVAKAGREYQWLHVPALAFKHGNCGVTFDDDDRAVAVRYSESWDLL